VIVELNISRRHFTSYPKGHPVVEAAFRKVIAVYDKLLATSDEISIGVAKDTLICGSTILEKTNPVYRAFARVLFEHGISVLTLQPGLNSQELEKFNIILGLKREELYRYGGIETLWEKSQIASLVITAIRYDLFTASEYENDDDTRDTFTPEGIWERFTRELLEGNLEGLHETPLTPEVLAELLNSRFELVADSSRQSGCMQTIEEFMQQESSRQLLQDSSNLPFDKLAAFVSKLNPDLRRQFLNSTFDLHDHQGHPITGNIVEKMSANDILETLEDLNQHQVTVPPLIMDLLQKLSAHAGGSGPGRQPPKASENEIRDTMHTILKERASEEFIPDEYQHALHTLVTEKHIPRAIPGDSNELLATVEANAVEGKISDIILNLVTTGGETIEERDFFLQNLGDMFDFFLQTGEYGQLVKMIERSTDGSFPVNIQYYLRENYARREFLDEILNGLTIWGKPRYHDINQLITRIRSPFIEVLLDHLATEENMSLRRFMMDRLIEMGPMTRVPISIRLNDERWFVLRNLIIILRAHSDASLIPLIRPLARHANIKVRQEALSTLVMLKDATAEKQILRDLDSPDRETLFAAISLAEKSRLPDILRKLLALLAKGGLTQLDYEVKSAVIKALGEIGSSEALPEFAKILGSSSLFHGKLLNRLKVDCIRALERFPLTSVSPLLERLCTGRDEIARQAQESLDTLKVKANER
jgi:HEAT repeat protein